MGMMTNLGSLVVILSHFMPGLILGALLIHIIPKKVPEKKKIMFVAISTVIHILCALFVNVGDGHEVWTPIKLLIASSIGALLLSLTYDIIMGKKVSLLQTILLPFIYGILASVLSAFCLFYIDRIKVEQDLLENFLWAGIFSIFPLWFYIFTRNIENRNKTISKTEKLITPNA